jgi:VWFA-related protein
VARWAAAIAGLLGIVLLSFAQTPTPPGPQEAPPLRVTTRLVQLNVIVTDRRGNPIPDLTRGDFVLTDEKEEQSIEVFTVETSRSDETAKEGRPTNTFSNHLDQKGTQAGSVTVILLDGLNTQFGDQAYARMQIVKFLRQI